MGYKRRVLYQLSAQITTVKAKVKDRERFYRGQLLLHLVNKQTEETGGMKYGNVKKHNCVTTKKGNGIQNEVYKITY